MTWIRSQLKSSNKLVNTKTVLEQGFKFVSEGFSLIYLLSIGSFTYQPICSVDNYLQKMVAVPVLQDDIINHLPQLKSLLTKEACEVCNSLLYIMLTKIA